MSADAFLSRLDKVHQTGPGRSMARCPAHERCATCKTFVWAGVLELNHKRRAT